MYLHGTYGELVPVTIAPGKAPSCVVYVGTAPVHKIKGQSSRADLFNTPIRITGLQSARKLLGYSEEAPFEKYTLCEAVEAHFKNAIENVGPIYCINVLDPNLEGNYVEDTEGIALDVLKKQSKFVLGDLILDSLQVESADEVLPPPPEPPIAEGEGGGEEQGQEPVEGEGGKEEPGQEPVEGEDDQEPNEGSEEGEEISTQSEELEIPNSSLVEGQNYTLAYDSSTDTVTLTFIGEVIPQKILVKGKIVNPTAIGASEIIGQVTEDGHKTGLQAIKDMYRKHDEITNIIAAPGFSEIPEVYEAMLNVAVKLNGHWDSFINADLPIKDNETPVNTLQKAIQWKIDHDYNNGRSKVYWPQCKRENGKIFHLSTIATAKMQALDMDANGVPYQSPSNKAIEVADFYCGENFPGYDQYEINELNEYGITSMIRWSGKYRLWGNHTAAYSYADEEAGLPYDPTVRFETSIRTMMHITNRFQADNFDLIDQPMTNALKDFIIQKEQSKLDAMASTGALLGQPKIYFSEDNSPEQIMGGNFVWDISATTGIPFKSGTVRLGYTDTGIYTLLGEEE